MIAVGTPLAVILAGGESRRMGAPKACADLAGRTMLDHVAGAFRAAGLDPAVVAKRRSSIPPGTLRVISEPDLPVHPLTGIASALRAAGSGGVVVCACDMPLVAPELLALLAAHETVSDALVPAWRGRLEPMCARYMPSALAVLEDAMSGSRPVKAALAKLNIEIVEPSRLKLFGDPDVYLSDADDPAALVTLARQLPG